MVRFPSAEWRSEAPHVMTPPWRCFVDLCCQSPVQSLTVVLTANSARNTLYEQGLHRIGEHLSSLHISFADVPVNHYVAHLPPMPNCTN